jgi:hypothetical protein
VRVDARDDKPRSLVSAGEAYHVLAHAAVPVVELEEPPIGFGDPPARVRILLKLLQAPLLLLAGQVEPELREQRVLSGEHALEPQDALNPLVQLGVGPLAGYPSVDRRPVPRAVHDGHLPLGREGLPVAPHRGAFPFLVGWLAEPVGLDVPRVHPLVEKAYRLALASTLGAGDHDDDPESLLGEEVVLRVEQRLPQFRGCLLERGLVDHVIQFGGLKHAVSSRGLLAGMAPSPPGMAPSLRRGLREPHLARLGALPGQGRPHALRAEPRPSGRKARARRGGDQADVAADGEEPVRAEAKALWADFSTRCLSIADPCPGRSRPARERR